MAILAFATASDAATGQPRPQNLADFPACSAARNGLVIVALDPDTDTSCDPPADCVGAGDPHASCTGSGTGTGGGGPTSVEPHDCVCDQDHPTSARWVVQPTGAISTTAKTVEISITQATHGFSVDQWLMYDATSSTWVLLDASAADADTDGVGVVTAVPTASTFTLATAGEVTISHGLSTGPLWASSTPGTLTDTLPAVGVREWSPAVAISSTSILVRQTRWLPPR